MQSKILSRKLTIFNWGKNFFFYRNSKIPPPRTCIVVWQVPSRETLKFSVLLGHALLSRANQKNAFPLIGNGSVLYQKRSKKGGIEGWSKPEESPVLSEAQIERRKRLQQRHDFEKIWSQEKKHQRKLILSKRKKKTWEIFT